MRSEEFDTAGLPLHAQLGAWQNWYARVFETLPGSSAEPGFVARNRAWNVGGLVLSHVSAPSVSVIRSKALIRREPVDHWAVTLSRRNVTRLSSGETSLVAAPGLPFVVSLGQEMRNARDADERVQLYLSRDTFAGIANLLDASCMVPIQASGGRLLADYLQLLLHNLPNLDPTDATRLVDATRSMIAACLAPTASRIAEARPTINVTLMERVRRAVRRHLHSADLGPDLICRDAATSRSQLYRLLESEGGVGRYIQKSRLSEAFSLLCEQPQGRTIAAIAEALCFADSSSFARAFRREFGVSPSDVRQAAQAGLGPVGMHSGTDEFATGSFADCLRAA